jgi:L-lactate permease
VGKEGILFKWNLLPLIIYGLVVGIAGMLLVYYFVPGLF